MGIFIKNRGVTGSDYAIGVPVGDTTGRPQAPVAGQIRFNTDDNRFEAFDGSVWYSITPNLGNLAAEQFTGDGVTTDFVLTNPSTTSSTIVNVNGVLQIPTTSYTVTGSTLSFVTAPDNGLVIDVRTVNQLAIPVFTIDSGTF